MGHQPTVQFTPEGGIALRMANGSPAPLTRGSVVKPDTAADDSVILTAAGDIDPIGIIYQDIPVGASGLVVIGGYADIYLDNAGATNREWWVGASATTPGQCTASAAPASTAEHFREVGHTVRAKGVGAGLCRCILHFN